MTILVSALDSDSMGKVEEQLSLPLWARAWANSWYGRCEHLVAKRDRKVVGVWTIPLTNRHGDEVAGRSCRLLPYAAPVLFVDGNVQRRRVVEGLFSELLPRVSTIDLPLAPGFIDTGTFIQSGVALYWRHTHILTLNAARLTSRVLRNHLDHATRNATIDVLDKEGGFDFARAIVGETSDGVLRRSGFGEALLRRKEAFYLNATATGRPIGQVFVAFDSNTAYLLHSWFDRQGVRGIPSLLIERAKQESAARHRVLDLEGSVLPGVDEFFCSFEATITPYCYLQCGKHV